MISRFQKLGPWMIDNFDFSQTSLNINFGIMMKQAQQKYFILVTDFFVNCGQLYYLVKVNIILILNQIDRKITMLRKNSNYRPTSPLRSPFGKNLRPVSPLRCSPFSRQTPMSPIRSRIAANSAITPNKSKTGKKVLAQKSPQNCSEQSYDVEFMQRTLKNGVGLFQQLAYQNKIGSEKKENRLASQNTNPFQYSDKKKECFANFSKNSFAALIQNVKEIQSIQASKANYISNQVSFKTVQKSKTGENEIRCQHSPSLIRKCQQPLPQQLYSILQSFGVSQNIKNEPELQKQSSLKKCQMNSIPNCKIEPTNYKTKHEIDETALINKQVISKANPQIVSSFEDVMLLIRKASEKVKDESEIHEEEVRMSIDEQISFNMNPFL